MLVENLMKIALFGAAWVMYLLLVMSVFSFGATFERWFFFKKHTDNADELGDQITSYLEKKDIEGARRMLAERPSVEAKVFARTLQFSEAGATALADAAAAELGKRRKDLERGLNFLGTVGSNAPFIGLFGTVIGVIEAFHYLGGDAGDDSAMGHVMAGIAEALVATGVGLFVAIPAVIAYNIFQAKVTTIEGNIETIVSQISAHIGAVKSGKSVSWSQGDDSGNSESNQTIPFSEESPRPHREHAVGA